MMRTRWYSPITMIAAACLALAGCGGTEPTDSQDPADQPTGRETTEPTGGRGDRDDPADEPPDIPGGPIDYDNTRTGGGRSPQDVQADMEGQLADQCGRNRCGVKVVISGSGDCVASVTPRPVRPGGRITVKAKACIDDEKPPSEEPESAGPSSDEDSGDGSGEGSGDGSDSPAESGPESGSGSGG
ncbi:hypothetical protein [Amycolatopsis albispora]|uniref:Uncharacterized protein n=1 Tax=Amycolatopsis albispora TaxID=1804986 RepID=A0A344L456_9PSEU|nr:hypothetical protein [Amycolatopsis albispora]AXB42830.1 hypothetical protein A4R43_10020 [Amycolatopsis albispora]